MKLRVSLALPQGGARDVTLSCDVTASVGDTARTLIRAGAGDEPRLRETAASRRAPVTLRGRSAEGGPMALEIDGVFAARAANVPLPNLAALAHSYGTTTMANALTLISHKVQSFTMLASAGLDGQKIKGFSDLKVESAPDGSPAVYTTMASKDYVARIGSSLSGRLQPNPEVAGMGPTIDGAHQFSSDGAGDLKATTGHDLLKAGEEGYLDQGTQSLWNSAAVTMGADDLVVGELNVTSTPVWQVVMQMTHESGIT